MHTSALQGSRQGHFSRLDCIDRDPVLLDHSLHTGEIDTRPSDHEQWRSARLATNPPRRLTNLDKYAKREFPAFLLCLFPFQSCRAARATCPETLIAFAGVELV